MMAGILSLGTPAFAEPDRSSLGAARQYVSATYTLTEQVVLPPNLHVSPIHRELVESMARQSPTFRRQLLRIASEPGLTVDVQAIPATHILGARAATRIVRQSGGGLAARIELTRLDDVVELMAHEIEHVIEQIDGVDLAAYASLPDSGVHAVAHDGAAFETVRATRVGVNVAQEVRASGQRGD